MLHQIAFEFFVLFVFNVPFLNTVGGLFFLKSPEDRLVFDSDLNQIFLPAVPVKTAHFKSL